jgi:hypothetical protein
VRTIAAKVEDFLETIGEPGAEMDEGGMIQLPDAMGRVPEAVELLRPDVVATLEAYYRSYFKVFCMEIHRLVPTRRDPQLSSLWHLDNYPPGMLKVFVYLTDCDRKTGALRLNSRARSRRLIRSGFLRPPSCGAVPRGARARGGAGRRAGGNCRHLGSEPRPPGVRTRSRPPRRRRHQAAPVARAVAAAPRAHGRGAQLRAARAVPG